MTPAKTGLLPAVAAWLETEPRVQAAVLFGSGARAPDLAAPADDWADIDLHLVTTATAGLERMDWPRTLPGQQFCLQVVRPATGGVRKVTVLFTSGGVDLVLVPAVWLCLGRMALRCGLHRKVRFLRVALNELATCMRPGYRFLKGEKAWGAFYARLAVEMPGVRVGDREARDLADVFLCDLSWVLQKLERGELSAAQHMLHRQLAETNFRLMRELRLRRSLPLPSFGLARHVETLLSPDELALMQVDARLDREELHRAAWRALEGLKVLMGELAPAWTVPAGMAQLLASYSIRRG